MKYLKLLGDSSLCSLKFISFVSFLQSSGLDLKSKFFNNGLAEASIAVLEVIPVALFSVAFEVYSCYLCYYTHREGSNTQNVFLLCFYTRSSKYIAVDVLHASVLLWCGRPSLTISYIHGSNCDQGSRDLC